MSAIIKLKNLPFLYYKNHDVAPTFVRAALESHSSMCAIEICYVSNRVVENKNFSCKLNFFYKIITAIIYHS